MIDSLSTVGFIALLVCICTGIMIVLQACVARRVWGFYLLAFFAALVTLLVTLR